MMKIENLNANDQQKRDHRRRLVGFTACVVVASIFWLWLTCFAPVKYYLILSGMFAFTTCAVALLALFKPWR